MSDQTSYPGSKASAEVIIHLALEYHEAAKTLLLTVRKRKPLSRAPFLLCAIHAVELYLNALLLCLGHTPEKIRSLGHDLAGKSALALAGDLKLRRKTEAHLVKMSEVREYLLSRYDPDMLSNLSESNRLMATLDEIGKKAASIVLDQNARADRVGA